jgi:hypothetical protein
VPPVILIGLALMATGGTWDLVASVGPVDHHGHAGVGTGHLPHLVAIAGMVLVFVGVVAHGVRSHRRPGAATHGGLDHDAHR